ncbi:MAG: AAA family ATPase [Desulfoprunum sp.]|nr:AAA family ATPase [Desulfoprunum sp.]
MKILQIRLKNLNSLVGEWEIDLTHPAYETGGIFAITGPTGAGKTTILDAVCLALYGRTPRLARVSKGANDIMSRQTGECYAEVTFATQSGRYCSHWSQRRARRKADGELQAPKHEISNLDTGLVVETKLRGVAEQIELVTGMDFDRFTRSMLLAQGGFAAFLQAAADERAPILEQITGTGIYSQISMKVHERRSEERRRLDVLQAELAGLQLLGEEDMRLLQVELEQKGLRETDLNEALTGAFQAIAWLEAILGLEKELSALAGLKEDLAGRRQAFQPQRLQLERALQALELAGEYAALVSLRGAQESDQKNHSECLQALPGRQAEIIKAEEGLQVADAGLTRKRVEQKETLSLIRLVRELDLKLAEKLLPIRAATESLAVVAKNLDTLRTKTEADRRTLAEQRQAFNTVQQFLDENRVDERLGEQLGAVCARFDALRILEEKKRLKTVELGLGQGQKDASQRLWQETVGRQEMLQQEYALAQTAWQKQQIELQEILAGREIADWRDRLSALKERKTLLQRLAEAGQALTEARRVLGELLRKHEQLTAEKTSLASRTLEQAIRQAALEREMGLLETQLTLLKRIDDLKESRQQLRDGEQCPLCGAKEHPFALGNIPVPDETTAALQRVRADLKEAGEALSRLKVMAARSGKDLEHVEVRQKDCAETIGRAEEIVAQGFIALELDAAGRDPGKLFLDLQQENDLRLAETEERVQVAQQGEKGLAVLRDAAEKSREATIRAEREGQAAAHAKETAEQALGSLEKDLEMLAAEHIGLSQEVLQEVLAYGVQSPALEDLDQLQGELIARRERWQVYEGRKNELEKVIAGLEVGIEHATEQIGISEAELGARRQALATLVAERDLLTRERFELFADKNTDTEENLLLAAVDAAGKKREEADRLRNAAIQELEKLKSRLETMAKAMVERDRQLHNLDEDFAHRLKQSGFGDEQGYQAACLPENERITLLQERERLDTEGTETEARWRDKTLQLTAERRKQVTDRPHTQLLQEREEHLLGLKELQQEIGGIRRRLQDDDMLRQKQQEKIGAVERQNREFRRWDMLHALIGSADGKKYRNFAQGLTFEVMIGHANRQLRKMTDRYLLIRDEMQPLDLNVVDSYQAGEIRSTRNLSGGESFLVSLSLALGLSQMASRNVRLDSLFLDEGFGTLDEEALDTALQTLAGLQQDGKLIGVISHVPALQERISARIQVSSRTGGRSVIEGPGCRRKGER